MGTSMAAPSTEKEKVKGHKHKFSSLRKAQSMDKEEDNRFRLQKMLSSNKYIESEYLELPKESNIKPKHSQDYSEYQQNINPENAQKKRKRTKRAVKTQNNIYLIQKQSNENKNMNHLMKLIHEYQIVENKSKNPIKQSQKRLSQKRQSQKRQLLNKEDLKRQPETRQSQKMKTIRQKDIQLRVEQQQKEPKKQIKMSKIKTNSRIKRLEQQLKEKEEKNNKINELIAKQTQEFKQEKIKIINKYNHKELSPKDSNILNSLKHIRNKYKNSETDSKTEKKLCETQLSSKEKYFRSHHRYKIKAKEQFNDYDWDKINNRNLLKQPEVNKLQSSYSKTLSKLNASVQKQIKSSYKQSQKPKIIIF